jgi:hypothetical protein
MKKLLFTVALLIGLCGIAKADIFQPISPVNENLKASAPIITTGQILADATSIINYLGVQEGYAYNFRLHKFDAETGATVITYAPWGIDLGIAMLDTDGVAATIDWNAGKYLPANGVPILQYVSYFYLSAGIGGEADNNGNWQVAPIVAVKAKFSF